MAASPCDLTIIDLYGAATDISRLAAMADLIVIPLHCTMPDLDAAEVAL
jgi:cellulose biosynthesis protein BcsQ